MVAVVYHPTSVLLNGRCGLLVSVLLNGRVVYHTVSVLLNGRVVYHPVSVLSNGRCGLLVYVLLNGRYDLSPGVCPVE